MAAISRHYIVWDTETSGLDPEQGAEIVQIGATCYKYQNYEPHEIGNFSVLIKPQHPEKADPGAIEVIGKELWEKAQSEGLHPKTALKKFANYIESANYGGKYWTSPIMVGFNNSGFDNKMRDYHMKEHKIIGQKKDDVPWSYLSIDMLPLMISVFGRDNLPNHKLDTFLDLMGISRTSSVHSAIEDANLTGQLFIRYMKFMQKIRPMIKVQKETTKV